MLQQTEVAELVNDLNRRRDEKSFSYALIVGFLALTLMMFGLTMLYSTSFATVGERFFNAQLKWAVIGLCMMAGVIVIGYKRIGSWCKYLLPLLAILLIWAACSRSINGANRWIIIPGLNMRFQPSEMAKVVLALYGAKIVSENLRNLGNIRKFKVFILPGAIVVTILALIALGKDLGTTLLLCTAMLSLIFSGGLQKRWLLIIPIGAALLAFYLIEFDPERMSRVTSFMNPGDENMRDADGYQL